MTTQARTFTYLMFGIAAALTLIHIWTADERWAGSSGGSSRERR